MNDLKSALEAAGIGGALVDPTLAQGLDMDMHQKGDDGLEIPAFLKAATAPPPKPEPQVVNTPVPAPVPLAKQEEFAEDPEPAQVHSNQPNPNADRRTILRDIGRLGEQEANGVNARPAFFEKVMEAARLGAVGEDDAAKLHEVYSAGVAKAKGVAVVKMGSEPQQISKVKTMIKLGKLTGVRGDVLIADVRDAIKARRDANNPTKKSPADCYLTAARVQLSQPNIQLSAQQIEEQVLSAKAPAQKIEADILYQFAAAIDKKLESEPFTDESAEILETFLGVIDKRVKDLGGTTKQQRDAAKLAEKEKKLEAEKAKAATIKRS